MRSANKIRLIVFTTIFGVLWGLIEVFFGTYLHIVKFPFSGALMAGVGAVILCIERTYTPSFGATVYTGIIALAIKFLSIGAMKFGPAAGILIEAFIVEAVLTAIGTNRISFITACILCCLEGIPHFFATNWIIYGKDIFTAYLDVIKQMQLFFGLNPDLWKQIVFIWIVGHLFIGLASAIMTISIAKYLRKL